MLFFWIKGAFWGCFCLFTYFELFFSNQEILGKLNNPAFSEKVQNLCMEINLFLKIKHTFANIEGKIYKVQK